MSMPDELAILFDEHKCYESFDVMVEDKVHTVARLKKTWWLIPVVLKFASDTFKGSVYLQPHLANQITIDDVKEFKKVKIKIKQHWSAIPHGD